MGLLDNVAVVAAVGVVAFVGYELLTNPRGIAQTFDSVNSTLGQVGQTATALGEGAAGGATGGAFGELANPTIQKDALGGACGGLFGQLGNLLGLCNPPSSTYTATTGNAPTYYEGLPVGGLGY